MNVPDPPEDLMELLQGGDCVRGAAGKCIKRPKCRNDTQGKCTKSRKCVLFVGAGLSKSAGLPDWEQLLRDMIQWGEDHSANFRSDDLKGPIEDGNLSFVAGEIRDRLKQMDFYKCIRHVFDKPCLTVEETHLLLPEIPLAAVLTTNYDTLLEAAYAVKWCELPHFFTHKDTHEMLHALQTDEFYIFKLHGTINRLETIILSKDDYDKLFKNQAYKEFVTTLFSTKTVLFIGYSIRDPDLSLFLDILRQTFDGPVGEHYALMDDKSIKPAEENELKRYYGIRVIRYKSTPEHPEVAAFLQKLLQRESSDSNTPNS